MRGHRIVIGWICVVALSALCMMSGCPQPAQFTEETEPVIDTEAIGQSGGEAEESGEDAGTIADLGVTMADVISKWPSSFVMTQTITDTETDTETVVTSAVKMADGKPAKIKGETADGGTLIDFGEGVMYAWQSGGDVAMKMTIPEDAAENPYENVDADTKIVGEDLVDGVECWVTETTIDDTTSRTWWGKDDGLIRRTEQGDTVVEFKYDQIDSVLDSEFELPAGMSVQEAPAMPNIPEMPNQ